MEADYTRARASFMNRACDLRDQLHFAEPKEKMQAINHYCSDGYVTCSGTLRVMHLKSFLQHGTFSQEWRLISQEKLTVTLFMTTFART